MDDEQRIIQRAQGGDNEAFAWIVNRYQSFLVSLVRLYLSRTEVSDAVQDIWVCIYKKLWQLDDGDKLRPWLSKLVYYQCVNYRKYRTRRYRRETYLKPEMWLQLTEYIVDPSRLTEEIFEQRELRRQISDLLDELPSDYGLIIRLRYFRDLTYDEITELTQLSLSTVKWRIHYGKQLLRAKLAEEVKKHGRVFL